MIALSSPRQVSKVALSPHDNNAALQCPPKVNSLFFLLSLVIMSHSPPDPTASLLYL